MSEGSRAPRCWAVVPAAGSGQRMGASKPKQYLRLAGATVIEHTLAAFLEHPRIAGVVVVLAKDDAEFVGLRCAGHAKVSTVVGGDRRSDSVLRGVEALDARAAPYDWVLVHDAARPCLKSSDIDDLLSALAQDPIGGLFAVKAGDTLKNANEERSVGTLDRLNVWRAQTPQMFRVRALREALQAAAEAGTAITDEASAVEALGHRPRLVPGPASNIKVTEMGDLQVAEAILLQRQGGAMRVGQGFDVHRFGDGDHVMLGGVRVPYTRGVVAHSDGDVILHALCDALLGAAGLGDIGQHFPDTDPKWRGAASAVFVRHVSGLLKESGWTVQNVDVTLLAEEPKLSPHRVAIRECVASLLELAPAAVNLKATTLERMGFIGRGEGLAAQVIASLTPTLHHAT